MPPRVTVVPFTSYDLTALSGALYTAANSNKWLVDTPPGKAYANSGKAISTVSKVAGAMRLPTPSLWAGAVDYQGTVVGCVTLAQGRIQPVGGKSMAGPRLEFWLASRQVRPEGAQVGLLPDVLVAVHSLLPGLPFTGTPWCAVTEGNDYTMQGITSPGNAFGGFVPVGALAEYVRLSPNMRVRPRWQLYAAPVTGE